MSDRAEAGVWVRQENSGADLGPLLTDAGPVGFYDTTLRDGEQTVGVVFNVEQKVEIAKQLDQLGVGRIEAGFPQVSQEDAEAVRRILDLGLNAQVWGFSRALPSDVEVLAELGVKATVIEAPCSNIKMQAYGLSRQKILARVEEAVRLAAGSGILVAFFPVDGTRSELTFLEDVYRAAREAGAREAVVVDTIGACSPEAVERLVGLVRQWLGDSTPLHFHGHNDFGLATACAVAAVKGGASWIHGTINGMGERAGNADIGEVALALKCLYGTKVDLQLDRIRGASTFVARTAGYRVEPWKPLVGDNLFVRESGAVASQFHIPAAIEPYSAALVGADRQVVLGKKSGLASIRIKARELGLKIPDGMENLVLAEVKRRGSEKRGLLEDSEFLEIVRSVLGS